MGTTITDHTAEAKKRSYRNRLKAGDRVEFLTGVVRSTGRARRGDTGTVISEYNSGFRGIEASIRLDGNGTPLSEGPLLSQVSTGLLRKLP